MAYTQEELDAMIQHPTSFPGWTLMPDGRYRNDSNGSIAIKDPNTDKFRTVGPNGQLGESFDAWAGANANRTTDGNYNEMQIDNLRDPNSLASNAYNWQGSPGGAAADVAWNAKQEKLIRRRMVPTVDLSNDAQSRGLMMAGAQGYQGMLAGTGPSLADSALRNGMQTAQGNAAQLQAGASRNNMAAAGRGAMMGLAGGGQAAAQAGVNQRLAEQNAATSGLASASTGMYSGDINSAKQRADLHQATRTQNDQAAFGFAQNGVRVQGEQMNAQQQKQLAKQQIQNTFDQTHEAAYELQQRKNQRAANTVTSATGAATTVGGAYYSDKNLKTDIGDASSDVRDAMNELSPYAYRYKDEGLLGAGKHAGIMAQDLEKSKLGKQVVVETAKGKAVSIPRAVGLVLASVADLNKRLAKVEK